MNAQAKQQKSPRTTTLRRQGLLGASATMAVVTAMIALAMYFQLGMTHWAENLAQRNAPRLAANSKAALDATRCRREDQQLELSLDRAPARITAYRAWTEAAEQLEKSLNALGVVASENERAEIAAWKSDAANYSRMVTNLAERSAAGDAFRQAMAPHRARLDGIAGEAEAKALVASRQIGDGEREIEALLASGRTLTGTALLASAMLVLAGLLWVWLSVLRRVSVLSDALDRLVAGEHATRLMCDSGDEIGALAARINQLAETLEEHARRTPGSPTPEPVPVPATAPATGPRSGPCRVLVVEDGPENRRFMNLVLRRGGVDVTLAENGREAVDKAMACGQEGQPEFDLILMDMEMPVMNGHDATRQLRQLGYSGQIIAVTGHTRSYDREKCLDAGCDQYVCKPVDRDTLLSLVGVAEAPSAPSTDDMSRV